MAPRQDPCQESSSVPAEGQRLHSLPETWEHRFRRSTTPSRQKPSEIQQTAKANSIASRTNNTCKRQGVNSPARRACREYSHREMRTLKRRLQLLMPAIERFNFIPCCGAGKVSPLEFPDCGQRGKGVDGKKTGCAPRNPGNFLLHHSADSLRANHIGSIALLRFFPSFRRDPGQYRRASRRRRKTGCGR